MCGICGFNFKNEKLIRTMADSIKHRGPDGEGYYVDNNVSLGHRRLSIIDLQGGKQPMTNENNTIWLIFNGEIYNFQEIKTNLEKAGHKFKTHSDTEAIIHAYEEYGVDCLNKFNGMFAFCLYDINKKALFLARDRFGKKPLYYYYHENKFYFASEIKALLQPKEIETSPNDDIIYAYLHHGYLPEDKSETFFRNIYKLMPGNYILFKNNQLTIKPYYKLTLKNIKNASENTEAGSIDRFREIFIDSVRLRLISDVPVGTCLSGGLDSSSIVSVMNRLGKKNIHCFSAVYQEKEIDERKYIKEVLNHTSANEHMIFPKGNELWKEVDKLIYHQDEPVESLSTYAQWCVMKIASKHVKVVLDGQGGDETLAGYIPYLRNYFLGLIKQGKIGLLLKEVIFSMDYLAQFLKSMKNIVISDNKKNNFFRQTTVLKRTYFNNNFTGLHERMHFDLTHSIQKVLRYEDRNSMAFGIEARLPFLDYRLVEFIFSIPENFKFRNGRTKYILRQTLKDILPKKIIDRRSKLGFPVPDVKWLLLNKKTILKIFNSRSFKNRPYFFPENIIESFNKLTHKSNCYLVGYFWRILNTELWLRIFFDRKKRYIN